MHLINENYQDPTNYQNYIRINLCSLLRIQKVLKSNPIRLSLWLQILPNPSQRYNSSCEILWFVNIVHDRLCETYSIFTIATTYDIMRSWQISWFSDFAFFFYNLNNHSATRSWSCFPNKMFVISFHFPRKASHWTQ